MLVNRTMPSEDHYQWLWHLKCHCCESMELCLLLMAAPDVNCKLSFPYHFPVQDPICNAPCMLVTLQCNDWVLVSWRQQMSLELLLDEAFTCVSHVHHT